LQVNYHIVSEEANNLKTKNQELMQFKINFEENQKKFRKQVEANAGDVAKHMKEITD
jgi:hypothetical protein